MKRSDSLARLGEEYDLLVIGGGATGLGIAVDSAARGYHTLLVEAQDFAQATSSRSTKLVHGGVRYLAQGNIALVREALHERGILLRIAPHLAHELRFLVPAYRWPEMGFYATGLKMYDLLAGSLGLTPTQIAGPDRATAMVPTLQRRRLKGGIVYSDAQFNDARLAISLARTAEERGAVLLNYAPARSLLKTNGRLAGAVVLDAQSGQDYEVRARCVVNATGVLADGIRRMDDPQAAPMIAASQGIHLVLDRSFLPGDTAIMVPHTDDGRVLFVIPWQGRALVGTTDTPVAGPSVEPVPLESEIDFVLRHAGRYLARQPERGDVLSAFAGLRPLVKGGTANTAALSRDHTLQVSPSGLVTITGGKWTTYRRMAEDAVNAAALVAGLPPRPCITSRLPLHGSGAGPLPHTARRSEKIWIELGATPAEIAAYTRRYFGELHAHLPYTMAHAAFAIEQEMAVKLEDVLSRRLRALLLDARAAAEAAPRVAELMARLQGRDATWAEAQIADFRRLAKHYLA